MKRSKNYRNADNTIDRERLYSPAEAVKLAKETSPTKFDATVEVALRLGVDPRKADQMVRGTVNLPHGTGKTARVLVFAQAEKAEAAREAGADWVGGEIEFRVDRHANLHFIIGKASFSEAQLAENYAAALEEVLRLKPASSKGRYVKKVTLSTTMGPGVQVDPNRTRNVAVEDEAAQA